MGNKVRDMHTAILVGESLMVCSKIVSNGPDLKAVCITNHGCNKTGWLAVFWVYSLARLCVKCMSCK